MTRKRAARRVAFFLGLSLCVSGAMPAGRAVAQTPPAAAAIRYDAATRTFRLDAADVTYILGVNEKGVPQSLYWGHRLQPGDSLGNAHSVRGSSSFEPSINATPQEYVAWGGALYVTPDLKVSFPDGTRELRLRYLSYTIQNQQLRIRLKDTNRNVLVTLQYRMDPATGILARSATITNATLAPLTVNQAYAATWNLPRNRDYQLLSLAGRWAAEWNVEQQALRQGEVILESRQGSTSNINPWFAITRGSLSNPEQGDVWFGALGWSGSWRITIEQNWAGAVRVSGGFNPFDFAYRLAPGQSLRSPVFYGGYSDHGIGGASRLMHRLELHAIVPGAPHPRLRPVLYNSWYATRLEVTEAGQEKLAAEAARLGVERFVMDDGWYRPPGHGPADMGDWRVDRQKFPHGLKPLIDKVHALGMDFGLWIEPEVVSPDSEIFRKHPDWVLHFKGEPEQAIGNRLVLNLARPDVKQYVFHELDSLLTQNDIAFLKWDHNRNWSDAGWPSAPEGNQQALYVAYIRNLYSILAELRARHPGVEIESCAGGGSRVDLGILRYADQVWPSDNTDPFDRLTIQNGFSYAYSPALMMDWVTDSPSWVDHRTTSLTYRFLSSMQGGLGIGADLNQWSEQDFAQAATLVKEYKGLRRTIQTGDLYRLISPVGSEYAASESVASNRQQAVIFAFLHSSHAGQEFPVLFPLGLDPAAQYALRDPQGGLPAGTPRCGSGDFWMHRGIAVALRGDFQAALLILERTGPPRPAQPADAGASKTPDRVNTALR